MIVELTFKNGAKVLATVSRWETVQNGHLVPIGANWENVPGEPALEYVDFANIDAVVLYPDARRMDPPDSTVRLTA